MTPEEQKKREELRLAREIEAARRANEQNNRFKPHWFETGDPLTGPNYPLTAPGYLIDAPAGPKIGHLPHPIPHGVSGKSGASGWSGYSGQSGSGSGGSGLSGKSGWSGYSGTSGESGFSGTGLSGTSGFSGLANLPPGGSADQVLAKNSSVNGDASWSDETWRFVFHC